MHLTCFHMIPDISLDARYCCRAINQILCFHRVKDVMTALEHTFLLEERSRLNFSTMLAIYKVSMQTRTPCCLLTEVSHALYSTTSGPTLWLKVKVMHGWCRAASRAYQCTVG